MWRCFHNLLPLVVIKCIFSTYVEVFPFSSSHSYLLFNFLHVCGGVSGLVRALDQAWQFSPRMWRCFSIIMVSLIAFVIFSTYVEVFHLVLDRFVDRRDFLHVCGGVSIGQSAFCSSTLFSPRMWRCFSAIAGRRASCQIFSTYVEVFLEVHPSQPRHAHFLHVCGGVSDTWETREELLDFLHVCGGVSLAAFGVAADTLFSPRMWRCFRVVS